MDTINQSRDPEPWEHAFYNARAAKMVSDLTDLRGQPKDNKGEHEHLTTGSARKATRRQGCKLPPGPCPICQTQRTDPRYWHWRAQCPSSEYHAGAHPTKPPRPTDSWNWEDPTWSPKSLLLLQQEEDKLKTQNASRDATRCASPEETPRIGSGSNLTSQGGTATPAARLQPESSALSNGRFSHLLDWAP